MENRIKEQQLYLFADRTSASTMRANQLRLWLSSVAYVLMNGVRELGLKGTQLERAQCKEPNATRFATSCSRLELRFESRYDASGYRCQAVTPSRTSSNPSSTIFSHFRLPDLIPVRIADRRHRNDNGVSAQPVRAATENEFDAFTTCRIRQAKAHPAAIRSTNPNESRI